MTLALTGAGPLHAPFPGLRAFDADEALLFYGRERHVIDLLDRLGDHRFLAVTGTSGSGKSSLVRAGLRPALQRGYLIDATSRWRFAVMRPGGAPIEALAAALAEALPDQPYETIVRTLRTSSAGLAAVVEAAALPPGESLLVIADQFEELFRFEVSRDQQANAALFVSLLLEAAEQRRTPIYVVMTMRSEFLGRCAEFAGLTEACNRSQYLVPRLTRDERQEAIERPLRLFGTVPTPALVQQVLNDAGDDPDLLPVLQHVMLRTYRAWESGGRQGRLEQSHYAAVGGIERALDLHGDEILGQLDPEGRHLAERMFRSLTVVQNGVALRRPRRVRELYEVIPAATEAQQAAVRAIVSRFADRTHSFLMLSSRELTPETVVDITHESLIRKWRRLDSWVRDESRSAEWLDDLFRDVGRRRTGDGSLWQDPELATVLRRRTDEQWSEGWANQYRRPDDPTFAEVTAFLDASAAAQDKAARAKRWQTIVRIALGVAAIVIVYVGYQLIVSQREMERLSTEMQKAADASREATARLTELERERERLRQAAASPNATAQDQARLQQLMQEIESARAQAKGSQDELAKLKKDQQLTTVDRSGLLKEIDALRSQLTQVTNERDKLQAERRSLDSKNPSQNSPVQSSQLPANNGEVAALTRQLEQERAETARLRSENATLRSAAAGSDAASTAAGGDRSTASVQDVTKAFGDGVRAYDLKNWGAAIRAMQDVVRLQAAIGERPKEVRLSGTRFVPFSPQSYLAAAQYQAKADCAAILTALDQSGGEPTPIDLRGALASAKAQCAAAGR